MSRPVKSTDSEVASLTTPRLRWCRPHEPRKGSAARVSIKYLWRGPTRTSVNSTRYPAGGAECRIFSKIRFSDQTRGQSTTFSSHTKSRNSAQRDQIRPSVAKKPGQTSSREATDGAGVADSKRSWGFGSAPGRKEAAAGDCLLPHSAKRDFEPWVARGSSSHARKLSGRANALRLSSA